ncbi:MAG: TetR/AcrR family transcriptional regulator [Oscillospiraceae bacterium]|nr:TetR/AcrR family transcriptional regulator [Oscillospiraceae bacterium]
MYKLCKSEQSARRQRQLEEGLLRVMNVTSFEDITISDLCQQLGIPRKSFYRYFSSKDGALHALIDHTLMEYEQFNAARPADSRSLNRDLETYFLFWLEKKPFLDALAKNGINGMLFERSLRYVSTETVLPSRLLDGEAQRMRQHVISFTICGLMTMMLQWYADGYKETPAEMAAIAARLITMPLFPDIGSFLK